MSEGSPVANVLIQAADWRKIDQKMLSEQYHGVPAAKPEKIYPMSPVNVFIINLVNGSDKTFSTEDVWKAANEHFDKELKRSYVADRIYHLRKRNHFQRIGYDQYRSNNRTTI